MMSTGKFSFVASIVATVVLSFSAYPALGQAQRKAPPQRDLLAPVSVQAALDAAYAQFKDLKEGANADYIPALARVDSSIYGVVLVTTDGKVYTKGDISSEVSIQSISKVFTMAEVMEEQGPEALESNIGVNATRSTSTS